jgi:hypothetical protein
VGGLEPAEGLVAPSPGRFAADLSPLGRGGASGSDVVTPGIDAVPQAPQPDPQFQRGPDGLATGMSLPPPQATPQALAALMQLLQGQLPAQRQVELLREQGRVAGARVHEPDGRVRHFAFQRGPNERIVGAHPMIPPGMMQAPDGNHYLPDPARPGKYLMLRQR